MVGGKRKQMEVFNFILPLAATTAAIATYASNLGDVV